MGDDVEDTNVNDDNRKLPQRCLPRLKLLPSKGCLVCMSGANGCSHPFLILFFKSIGLSPSYGGVIVAFRILMSAISSQCCSAMGRYTRFNRYWFWFSCLFSVLTFIVMPWVASNKDIMLIPGSDDVNCTPSLVEHPTKQIHTSGCSTNDTQVYTMFFVMLSLNLANSAIECIIPGYTLPVIKTVLHEYGDTFDLLRNYLYNAIGFGGGALISGLSSDYYKPIGLSDYTSIFLVFLCFSILFIISNIFLYRQFTTNPADSDESSFHTMYHVFWKIKNIIFLGTVIFIGVANGIMNSFLLLVLDEMNSSRTLMGISVLISCLIEIIMFALVRHTNIMAHFNKPLRFVCVCVVQYFARFLLISYMNVTWMILPIQLLNLFGYPLFWIAVSDYIRIISPVQAVESMYRLIQLLYFVVGGVIANILGGILYASYHGKLWFRYVGFFYLFLGVMLIGFVVFDERYLQRHELRMSSFSSQKDFANSSISEIRDKILLDDENETYI